MTARKLHIWGNSVLTLSRASLLNFWSRKAFGSICPGGLPMPYTNGTSSKFSWTTLSKSNKKPEKLRQTNSQTTKISVSPKMIYDTLEPTKQPLNTSLLQIIWKT